MSVSHRIIVNQRLIAYDFAHRHEEKYKLQRRGRIKDCIQSIRRLQNNPTEADKYN